MKMPEYVVVKITSDKKGTSCNLEVITDTDIVHVVRCKDCKFYLRSSEKCEIVDTRLHFFETDKTWTEDCFCAWGERREVTE